MRGREVSVAWYFGRCFCRQAEPRCPLFDAVSTHSDLPVVSVYDMQELTCLGIDECLEFDSFQRTFSRKKGSPGCASVLCESQHRLTRTAP